MPTVPRPTHLSPGQVRTIDARGGITLRVLQGRLWLTQPGDAWDHFLEAGTDIHLTRAGVLVQADGTVGACTSTHSADYVLHMSQATVTLGKPAQRAGFGWMIWARHFNKEIGTYRFIRLNSALFLKLAYTAVRWKNPGHQACTGSAHFSDIRP